VGSGRSSGRLKLNGRLTSSSPLSAVTELQGLAALCGTHRRASGRACRPPRRRPAGSPRSIAPDAPPRCASAGTRSRRGIDGAVRAALVA
jgi:hypothetical protein